MTGVGWHLSRAEEIGVVGFCKNFIPCDPEVLRYNQLAQTANLQWRWSTEPVNHLGGDSNISLYG